MRLRFIQPAAPVAKPSLPRGEAWLHEPKMDGWRVQAHKHGNVVELYSKRGLDITRRFRPIAEAVAKLRAASAILDGEIVALDPDGRPDFLALHRGGRVPLVLYAFDLLHLDSLDMRDLPLQERKVLLRVQVTRSAVSAIRDVAAFDDGAALLAECERMGLEGVVAKRVDAPYRSGPRCGWVKHKTASWRAANSERFRLFSRDRR